MQSRAKESSCRVTLREKTQDVGRWNDVASRLLALGLALFDYTAPFHLESTKVHRIPRIKVFIILIITRTLS